MKVAFSHHARLRCRQRGISQSAVKRVLKDPEITYTGKSGEQNAVAKIDGARVRVVFFAELDCARIITVIRL